MPTLDSTAFPSLKTFWNVDSAVGKDQTNRTDDVWLVQFFLSETYKSKRLPAKFLPRKVFELSGLWQPEMHEAIVLFQMFLFKAPKDNPLPQLVNGRVDRAERYVDSEAAMGKWSTILYLNQSVKLANPNLYNNLLTAREVPSHLHWVFRRAIDAQRQQKQPH